VNRVMNVGVIHGARPDGDDAADAYYAMQRRYGPADRRRDRELQEARRPCVDTACDALDEFAKQCHEVSTSAGSALGSAPCIASGRLIGEHVLSALEVEAYSESLLKAGYRVWREGEPDQMRLRIESSWLQCEVDESIGTLRNVGVIQGLPVYMDPCDPEIWAIQAYLTVTGTADAVAAQRKRRDCDEQRDDATASRCAGRRVG
jgi:hypothetical protein